MIRNPDGSPYTVSGMLRSFNPCNTTEKDIFNQYDAEIIKINGSPIYYYELFMDVNNIDPLFLESRNKIWSQQPVLLYGFYDPITSQNFMNMFGIDSPDTDVMFELNYRAVDYSHRIKVSIGKSNRPMWPIGKYGARSDFKFWSIVSRKVLQQAKEKSHSRKIPTKSTDLCVLQ